MINHFFDEVVKKKKVGGRAKAMVVTPRIITAIEYFWAFQAYLQEINSPYKAIVAFSGSKDIGGTTYDEAKLNGFPSRDIPDQFETDEYRFLIVADKFQTGFDQPLLHTMYVDKVLSNVKAVQTLSRLNRAHPDKSDTFVLDFVNSADAIQREFEPFYKTTILSEGADFDRLNDLQDALDAFQVYSEAQVREFMARFMAGAERDKLDPILDTCTLIYKDNLADDEQIDFKAKAKSFVRGGKYVPELDLLSHIIAEFNNRFGNTTWGGDDKITRDIFEDLAQEVAESDEYQHAKANSGRQNAKIAFEKMLITAVQKYIFTRTDFYRDFTNEPEVKSFIVNELFRYDYDGMGQ